MQACSAPAAHLQMTMRQPAAVAMRAAVSLVAMPPVPHCVPFVLVSTWERGAGRIGPSVRWWCREVMPRVRHNWGTSQLAGLLPHHHSMSVYMQHECAAMSIYTQLTFNLERSATS